MSPCLILTVRSAENRCLSTIPAVIEQAEKMHDSDHKWATPMAWFYLTFMYSEWPKLKPSEIPL